MAAAIERAMAGRAGEGGGAGGLLPEGLIAAEPEGAATPMQPTPTEVQNPTGAGFSFPGSCMMKSCCQLPDG